jgi:peroxiredoxin
MPGTAALLAALGLLTGPAAAWAQEGPQDLVGRPAPALDVEWVVGEGPRSLEEAGEPLRVVAFFSAMCPACREALGPLDRVAREEPGVVVLGVSGDTPRMLRGLFASRPVAFPVGLDRGGTFGRYRIRRVPTLVILQGLTVRAVLFGYRGALALSERLQQLREADPR